MSKRDVEILVLYLLMLDGHFDFPEDIYRACRELRLTETRMRGLYSEVQLRYMQYGPDEARLKFIELVRSGSFESNRNGSVTFIVRDPLLHQYFEEWVADQDGFTDSSFNKNLVTVSVDVLASVIEALTVVGFEDVRDRFKGELAGLNEASDLRSLSRMFAVEFSKSAGAAAGRLSAEGLAMGLRALFIHATHTIGGS